jgi:hypothetical protein
MNVCVRCHDALRHEQVGFEGLSEKHLSLMHLRVRWPQGEKETKCKGVQESGRAAVCRKPPGLTRQPRATPGTYYVIILYY